MLLDVNIPYSSLVQAINQLDKMAEDELDALDALEKEASDFTKVGSPPFHTPNYRIAISQTKLTKTRRTQK